MSLNMSSVLPVSSATLHGGAPASAERPTKRQKVAIACDVCRAKKVKCDGVRPVCSPCAKRADRGVPCEYTSESRTSHGPSKGYVHHLEAKLRELQQNATLIRDSPAENPPTFSAINKPNILQASWSTSPRVPESGQDRPGYDYVANDQIKSNSSPAASHQAFRQTPGLTPQSPFSETNSSRTALPTLHPDRHDSPYGIKPPPIRGNLGVSLTPASLRDSMEAPPIAASGALSGRSLLFQKAKSRDHSFKLPELPSYNTLTEQLVPARPGYLGTRRSASFVRQVKAAIDSRVHVTTPKPHGQLNGSPPASNSAMQTPHISAPSVEYELPSRRTADNLLRMYWESVHPMFPFLDRQEFETIYANVWSGGPSESDESLHICTLNVVFALASQYSEAFSSHDRPSPAEKFFDRAQDLLDLDLLGQGSVEHIQCLLLMAQYLQSANSLHQCWMVGGLATRMAEGLGLHLPEMSERAANMREREHLRIIWHGCVLLDRILSVQFGRPASIDKATASQVPLPSVIDERGSENPAGAGEYPALTFYVHSLDFFGIVNSILEVSAPVDEPDTAQQEEYGRLFGSADTSRISKVLELDQRLTACYEKLPPYLKVDTVPMPEVIQTRQARITRARFLHGRLVLFRPIFSRFCLAQNDMVESEDSLPQRIALACSVLCLRAAHEAINIIHRGLMRGEAVLGAAPLWWNCILFVYTSATVLQAARLRPMIQSSIEDYDLETSWSRAMELMKALERYGGSAQRSAMALEILAEKITQVTSSQPQSERTDQRGEPATLPTPALSSATHPVSTPTTLAPIMPSVMGEIEASCIQIPGLDDPFDLSDFDFDLNDMSWLTSIPTDL